MLVAVTLLVLMMTVIVTIFSAATGALNGLQATYQLDSDLQQADITIRRDPERETAKMFPPSNRHNEPCCSEVNKNALAETSEQASWDDDLIMTNVRSFDVKLCDNALPGHMDLGWDDDLRLQLPTCH